MSTLFLHILAETYSCASLPLPTTIPTTPLPFPTQENEPTESLPTTNSLSTGVGMTGVPTTSEAATEPQVSSNSVNVNVGLIVGVVALAVVIIIIIALMLLVISIVAIVHTKRGKKTKGITTNTVIVSSTYNEAYGVTIQNTDTDEESAYVYPDHCPMAGPRGNSAIVGENDSEAYYKSISTSGNEAFTVSTVPDEGNYLKVIM